MVNCAKKGRFLQIVANMTKNESFSYQYVCGAPFIKMCVTINATFNIFRWNNSVQLLTISPPQTQSKDTVLTWPVSVFQNLMHLSAVPPPLANSPWWWGDQAMALTAAKCSVKAWTGWRLLAFQTNNLLSFPPEARYWLSGDHFNPQTSWRWPKTNLKLSKNDLQYRSK